MKKLDLIGQKFHRLLVIAKAEPIGDRKRSAWLCRCDCGTEKVIKTDELKCGEGGTKFCGCWNNEQRSARAKNMYSARIKYTPEMASAQKVWQGRYREMPFDDFFELSKQNCFYCGIERSNEQNDAIYDFKSSANKKEFGFFKYNGLDRVDNNLPHCKENCVPCCKFCNYAKRERTLDEFKIWIDKIYNHFILNNGSKKEVE